MKDDPKGFGAHRDDLSPFSLIGAKREDFGFRKPKPPREPFPTTAVSRDALNVKKEWLIKSLFAKGEHSRIIAPPMHMKSALIGSAANHLAAGAGDWHGYKIKKRTGVLYCALERPGLALRRLIAEQELMGWHELKLPIKVLPKRFSLASPEDARQLIDTINRTSDEFDAPVEFLPIDTWGKLIAAHGGDEQQAKDNNIVCGYLSDVREATGVHTAVLGHMGKDVSKGERGSNAPLGDADVVTVISGEEIFTLTVTDANDLSSGPLFSFRARKCLYEVDEDNGSEEFIWIVDPDPPAGDTSSTYEKVNLTDKQQAYFTILLNAGSQGLTLEEWNKRAKEEAGITQKATLFNLREALRSKKLIYENTYTHVWRVDHKS
jgi:hypothetical protein